MCVCQCQPLWQLAMQQTNLAEFVQGSKGIAHTLMHSEYTVVYMPCACCFMQCMLSSRIQCLVSVYCLSIACISHGVCVCVCVS